MDNFLTTKQVQDIFKIDRITVYRMLQDGRIKGIKIGNQWRFSQAEIERMLDGASLPEEAEGESTFPVHCVQTIQNLYSSVSKFNACVIDHAGEPVTRQSRESALCMLMQSSPKGSAACRTSWKNFIEESKNGRHEFTCHAGLKYLGAPIANQKRLHGLFLSGQFFFEKPSKADLENLVNSISDKYQLQHSAVKNSLELIPVLSAEQREQIEEQPAAAAQAIESILKERSAFMDRLQQIAELTQNL